MNWSSWSSTLIAIWETVVGTAMFVGMVAGVVAVFAVFEMWRKPGLLAGIRHRGYNLVVSFFNMLGLAAAGLVLDRIEGLMPEPGLIGLLWPQWKHEGWLGIAMATLTYTVVYDFFHYWAHRAQHEIAPFWTFHRVHHDDEAMDASTSVRHSLGAGIIGTVLAHFPTYMICGGGLLPYAGSILLFWVWFFFSHADLRVSLGPLGWVFVGPQQHRIHHGRSAEYHQTNYAQFFPFYDWLFGTLRMPKPGEWPATGVDGYDMPKFPLTQAYAPWRIGRRARREAAVATNEA